MAGQYAAYRLSMRVSKLEKIRLMLCITENELRCLCRPVDEILSVLCANSRLKELAFLESCRSAMNSGENFADAWKQSLADRGNVRYLSAEDIAALLSFGEMFGVTDVEGQLANCRLHTELLDERLSQARKQKEKYSSLSCGLGAAVGAGLIIILM